MTKLITIEGKQYPITFNMWAMTRIEDELGINFNDTTAAMGAGNTFKKKLEIANIGFAAGHRAEKQDWENKDWEGMADFLQNDGDLLEQIEHVYLFQVFGKKLEDIIAHAENVVKELRKAVGKEKDSVTKKGLSNAMGEMNASAEMAKNVLARVRNTANSLPSPGSNK